MTWVWGGLAEYTEPAPEPHVPHELTGFVVLLLFSYLPLPLLLLYVFAQLAHFRQRKTKGDCTHPKKKTAKRKGPAVDAPVQEESPVATEDGGLLGRGDVCKDTSCSDTPDGAGAAQVGFLFTVVSHFAYLVDVAGVTLVCFCLSEMGKEFHFTKRECIFVFSLLLNVLPSLILD